MMRIAKFTPIDFARICECRPDHTRLGFANQLAFVRLYQRFPSRQLLKIDDEIVTHVSIQHDQERIMGPCLRWLSPRIDRSPQIEIVGAAAS